MHTPFVGHEDRNIGRTTAELYSTVNNLIGKENNLIDRRKLETELEPTDSITRFSQGVDILYQALGVVSTKLKCIYGTDEGIVWHVAESYDKDIQGVFIARCEIQKAIAKKLRNALIILRSLEEHKGEDLLQARKKLQSLLKSLMPEHVEMFQRCVEVQRILTEIEKAKDSYAEARKDKSTNVLGRNVFKFAGHDFIVDHDNNNYIVPYKNVESKKWIKQYAVDNQNNIVKVNQEVHTQRTYDYNRNPMRAGKYPSILPHILSNGYASCNENELFGLPVERLLHTRNELGGHIASD
jgi:hypothetical protein